MNLKAIVYTSSTGYTAEYASLLGGIAELVLTGATGGTVSWLRKMMNVDD